MLKKMKLATKLGLILGLVLALIQSSIIFVTVVITKSAIEESTYGELNAVSKANSLQIQEIFDAASTVASDIQGYLERAYIRAENDPESMVIPTDEVGAAMCHSVIYDKVLNSINYDVENYLSENARNGALYNENIAGIGVMFEPYAFQEDIRDYAFYVEETNASDDITPFGEYSSYSQEAYYRQAASELVDIVTDPYEYNGVTMVTYAAPIVHNNVLQGIVMGDINTTYFSKVDSTNQSYPSMYATICDNTGLIIYDSKDSADIGKNLDNFVPNKDEFNSIKNNMAVGNPFNIETTLEDGHRVVRFFNPIAAGSETWWSQTAVDVNDVNSAVRSTVMWLIIISGGALVLIVTLIVVLLFKTLKPLKMIIGAAESIAAGNLDVHLDTERQDEIGMLSREFQNMSDNLKRMVSDVQYVLGEMAEGNFDVKTKAEDSYVGDFNDFLMSMRKLNTRLSDALWQINTSADQVASGSGQVSSGAQALSQGATEQASSIQTLAATVNEISSQVHDTAVNAGIARDQTTGAGEAVISCNKRMQEMIAAMNEIDQKSSEIGKIIKTIEDIAFQTNILALNAAVEAARAGAAGKGFAVVADEVRNLAGKSAEASKNTSALIESTIDAVDKGSRIASETAESLMQVVEKAHETSSTVDKIADAANEQAAGVAQVTEGIDQISGVVQTNSATAEESAAASEELSSQAQMLKELVSQFKLKETQNIE